MCGIAGGWEPGGVEGAALGRALEAMRHRGPDDAGEFREGDVFLGMRRLAIIDVEGGRQPIASEDGRTVVVSNGEIYNYPELTDELRSAGHEFRTQSDAETLVHAYEDDGPGVCRRLRGMFAFAIWDGRGRRLLLARDRFGKKPLYYARTPSGGLIFASELKGLRPLAEATGTRLEIRPQAVYDYLSLAVVPQPGTIYEGVRMVEPGSWLGFDGETLETGSYWSLDRSRHAMPSYDEALERVRSLVSESVRLRLRSDVPLGVFLSGGIDSSVIACEAARHVGAELRTFTVAVDDPELDESPVAARTAERLGVGNTVLRLKVAPLDELRRLVRHYDQPYADSSAIPSLAVSRLAREHVTVVLNGDGGDEVFAGYRRHLAARIGDRFGWLPASCARAAAGVAGLLSRRRRSALGFARRFARGLALEPGARYLTWTMDMMLDGEKRPAWKGGDVRATEEWVRELLPHGLSGLGTQMAGDERINLLSDLLVKMDMATMAASLEGRSPLLDHRVAEYAAGLPDDYLVRRRRTKSLLRDAYRGRVPDEVLGAPKRGFEVPLERWLQTDLREPLMDTVGSGSARVRDYLDGGFVDSLLDGGILRDRNRAYIVYSLLVLELWLLEFA